MNEKEPKDPGFDPQTRQKNPGLLKLLKRAGVVGML
jgi:hypothetical protein